MPAYQRVSALLCIEERVIESDPGARWMNPETDDQQREAQDRIARNKAWIEHSVVVRKGKADILSDHSYLLEAIKNNNSLQEILPKK